VVATFDTRMVALQGRELIATLASLKMEDDQMFLVLCSYLRIGCMLTYPDNQPKRIEDRDLYTLILSMTCRCESNPLA